MISSVVMAPRLSFTSLVCDLFSLSKGPARKMEFIRFHNRIVGAEFRGMLVGIAEFGVGAWVLGVLFVGESDSYGTAYGHVDVIYNGLPDPLLILIQSAVI